MEKKLELQILFPTWFIHTSHNNQIDITNIHNSVQNEPKQGMIKLHQERIEGEKQIPTRKGRSLVLTWCLKSLKKRFKNAV